MPMQILFKSSSTYSDQDDKKKAMIDLVQHFAEVTGIIDMGATKARIL